MQEEYNASRKTHPSNEPTSVPIIPLPQLLKTDSSNIEHRIKEVTSLFETKYKNKPDYIVRSPGRVNLIGEHIDYCGYDVLPMAIDKDILFAVKIIKSDTIIQIANKEKKFTPRQFDTSKPKEMEITEQLKNERHWTLYFQAGFLGVKENFDINSFYGMRILVSGNIPKGSGLSSSSAFVCGSVMSLLYANIEQRQKFDSYKTDFIANLCIKCERYVGVDSGGMDQTICMMAQKGYAKHVSFIPKLSAENVQLPAPEKCSWVISNCLLEHKLMDTEGTLNYNTRVVECRLGTLILAKELKLDNWRSYKTMRQIQDTTKFSYCDLLSNAMDLISPQKLTVQDCLDVLELKYEDLEEALSDLKTGQKFLKMCYDKKYALPIQLRVLHVYGEALRVVKFADICKNSGVVEKGTFGVMKELGELMNQSHESCRIRYECSCEELDELVGLCIQGGALGARLTGAGWGGCVVSLVPTKKIKDFILYLKKNYYASIKSVPLDAIFATSPSRSLHIIVDLKS